LHKGDIWGFKYLVKTVKSSFRKVSIDLTVTQNRSVKIIILNSICFACLVYFFNEDLHVTDKRQLIHINISTIKESEA